MTVRFQATSLKPFDDFRRDLDLAIRLSRVAHMLSHSWSAQNMSITGPGAQGKLLFREGHVHAEIRISFPAIMLHDRIVGDIRRMLESAAGGPVLVNP